MLRKWLSLCVALVLLACALPAWAEDAADEHVKVLKETESFSATDIAYPPIGDEQTYVSGTLVCDSPDAYKIITLIRVGSLYGPKPYYDEPYSFIGPMGDFEATFASQYEGNDLDCTEIYLYFVPEAYEHDVQVDDGYAVKSSSANQLLKDSAYALKITR